MKEINFLSSFPFSLPFESMNAYLKAYENEALKSSSSILLVIAPSLLPAITVPRLADSGLVLTDVVFISEE